MDKKEVVKRIEMAKRKHVLDCAKHKWMGSEFYLRMKYFTRLNVFKGSNVCFNPETLEATSYDWWFFVKKINGKLVFNDYRYSNSTRRHQRNVQSLLNQLGIKINLYVNQRESLSSGIKVSHLYEDLFRMEIHNANPKTRKKWDKTSFNSVKKNIKIAHSLGAKFDKTLQKELRDSMIKEEAQRVEKLRQDRLFVKNALQNEDLFDVA